MIKNTGNLADSLIKNYWKKEVVIKGII
jgi:hypothetical protein